MIDWHSLPFLAAWMMNVRTPYLKISVPFPLLAVPHESAIILVHLTHSSMNVGCIALFRIKKSNYSTHFIFGEGLVLSMLTYSLRTQNGRVPYYSIDGRTRDTVQHICAKCHLSFTVILVSRPIWPWKNSPPIITHNIWNNLQKLRCFSLLRSHSLLFILFGYLFLDFVVFRRFCSSNKKQK